MARNADYTQEYFDIMESLGGDIAGRRGAYHSMQHSTAIYHGSVVDTTFTPRLYDARTYRALRHTAETMHAILCKVIEHYLDDPDYRAAFSFDERLVDLILLPRGYDSLLPFARVDIFLDEDSLACKFSEFNADGSSGMNEDREAAASIAPSATFQRFSARHEARPSELFDTWVDDFLRIYAGYEHRVEHPRMAICDFLENSVIDEFKVFAERFAQKGMPCSICDVRDLRFDGEALRGPDGERIDAVWRRCVTNDVIDHWEASQALIEAVRAQKVALIGSFAGHIVHDKQVFRVLSEPVTKAFLTAEEAAFIEQSIPFTTFLDDAHIDLD
ncbi:MAG: carboxylate--amine ligase, partial [Eggerthellaceae bacterium]|nr:carboxylate--amine ligase [Eggerthellaceae bacterium]